MKKLLCLYTYDLYSMLQHGAQEKEKRTIDFIFEYFVRYKMTIRVFVYMGVL